MKDHPFNVGEHLRCEFDSASEIDWYWLRKDGLKQGSIIAVAEIGFDVHYEPPLPIIRIEGSNHWQNAKPFEHGIYNTEH